MNKYKPSGQCRARVFAYTAAAALAAIGVAGVYVYARHAISIQFVGMLLMFGFAALLLVAMELIVRMGRCRSVPIAWALALVVALAATGASHAFSYRHVREAAAEDMRRKHPASEHEKIEDLKNQFTFSMYVNTWLDQAGGVAYLLWAIEFGLLAGGALFGAHHAARKPYCEHCNVWTDADLITIRFPNPPATTIEWLKRATSVEHLLSAELVHGPPADDMLVYRLHGCPSCKQTAFLDVLHRIVIDDESHDTVLHEGVALSREQVDALTALKQAGPRSAAVTT